MNNDLNEKKDNLIIEKLNSSNESKINEAIAEIRQNGKPEFFPHMINLYKNSSSYIVKQQLFDTFIDIKDVNVIPYIVQTLKNPEYKNIKKDLLNICWQTSLDFIDYVDIFIEIFIFDDFETAFEAFTIIDCIDNKPDTHFFQKSIDLLISNTENIKENKQFLFEEILNKLNNL